MGILSLSTALVAATAFLGVQADVDPIVIKGSKFFYKTNGTEFFLKGVAYQQDFLPSGSSTTTTNNNYVDPLADVASCTRDIPNLVDLHANAIRVYAVDPTADHSKCMSMLQAAGIYVIADLSAPNLSIDRTNPLWSPELYARYASVIDALAPYSNVLGFFAGNEVTNNITNTNASPFVKAAVRDMKAYIKQKNYRPIGVGYAADDDVTVRANLENFMNCGSSDQSIDFFGYNVYSWCGQSDYVSSHYKDRTEEFANYSVPAFFAEYGCNKQTPRIFQETSALYGKNMTSVWSGGIVFEYFQATNNFGLVSVSGNTASKLPDYSALSKQIAAATPTGVNAASYTPSNTVARACPTATDWAASPSLPPTPNQDLCHCMTANLTCVANSGLSGAAIAELFNVACDPTNGEGICAGIAANGTTGVYGAYSMCSAADQLSWAFNAYYMEQLAKNSANTNACSFGGNATTQTPATPSGSCSALVSQAGGLAGTGTVTSQPTAGANGGAATGSGSGSGSASPAASSSGVAGVLTVPAMDVGLLKLGVYFVAAMMAGVGIVLM